MTQDLHHLAAAYALDALEPDERAAFEAHYPTCDICSAEVSDFRETAAVLAADAAVPPPSDLKASVMAEISRTRQLSPRRGDAVELDRVRGRRGRVLRAVAAVAAAVVLVVGTTVITRSDDDRFAPLLEAVDATFVTLEGDAGSIEAVWSDELDQVLVQATSLADPGEGLTYALWSLRDGEASPAGLFAPDADGSLAELLDVDDLDPAAWGVTIEPESGSPQPTGEVLFVGEV
ncbi:MAG: anti-sigma factor [Actinomycetota bacterium]